MLKQKSRQLIIGLLFLFVGLLPTFANCLVEKQLSPRIANYTMRVQLDSESKSVLAQSTITWRNTSPDTVSELQFYMYLNAFKNSKSSYLKDLNGQFFGRNFKDRKAEEWGWVEVKSLSQSGVSLLSSLRYIQDIDDNSDDQSVISIILDSPVFPGESVTVEMNFESKLPRTMVRSGYSKDDFFHWVHWYPKLGVYEQDEEGTWGWNCHQFLRQMEFYGDFGVYDITLEVPDHLIVGASGCMIDSSSNGTTKLLHYVARDVIDFAWTAYPYFEEYTDTYEHIDIRLLIPPEHCSLAPRLLDAAKAGLLFLDDRVGKYPYKTLTIIDPPVHALNSGFMEYPTLITGGAFYGFPKGVRTIESLIIHELSHQYFMGILASNEKEAPWLDEGFVTFYEDRIMEDWQGDNSSLIEILGLKIPNSALTRDEYTSLSNLRADAVDTKSWLIKGNYKSIIYSKTALVLKSLMGYLGESKFDEMMRSYFEENEFTHPRKKDFYKHVIRAVEAEDCLLKESVNRFLSQAIEGTAICDFAITAISHFPLNTTFGLVGDGEDMHYVKESADNTLYESVVRLERKEDFVSPVTVRISWDDDTESEVVWSSMETIEELKFVDSRKIISAYLDPDHQLSLDIDFNNNSYTLKPTKKAIWKYADRAIFWVQNIIQATSFLM